MIMAVVVHAANIQDRDGAKLVLGELGDKYSRLIKLFADGGYAGKLEDAVKEYGPWVLEIVKRPREAVGFKVLPKRWIVERTLAWLGRYRRMSKDYEFLTSSSTNMIYLCMTNLMLHRLKAG